MAAPKIFTTSEWKATPVNRQFSTQPALGIVIHNTESANRPALTGDPELQKAFALARAIQQDQMSPQRGFSDTGQHFTVSRGGILMEGRHGSLAAAQKGLVVQGAHAGKGTGVFNTQWFGIEIEGVNKDGFHVTEPQWKQLIELCAWLSTWGNFDSSSMKGHLEVSIGGTDCPGKIMDHLARLKQEVHDRKVQIVKERA